MSEMAFWPVSVPLIRPWLGREYRRLAHEFYGGRGFFFAWGWLFWLWAVCVAIKATIFWAIVALMVCAWFCTATYDLLTYRGRLREAQLREERVRAYLARGETA